MVLHMLILLRHTIHLDYVTTSRRCRKHLLCLMSKFVVIFGTVGVHYCGPGQQASSGRAIQSKVHALSAYCVAGTVIDLWY